MEGKNSIVLRERGKVRLVAKRYIPYPRQPRTLPYIATSYDVRKSIEYKPLKAYWYIDEWGIEEVDNKFMYRFNGLLVPYDELEDNEKEEREIRQLIPELVSRLKKKVKKLSRDARRDSECRDELDIGEYIRRGLKLKIDSLGVIFNEKTGLNKKKLEYMLYSIMNRAIILDLILRANSYNSNTLNIINGCYIALVDDFNVIMHNTLDKGSLADKDFTFEEEYIDDKVWFHLLDRQFDLHMIDGKIQLVI